MSVPDWSTDPNANISVGGINIAENCPAGNVNNALRELMAEIAQWVGGAPFQPNDSTLAALAAITTAADQLVYATGPDAFATSPLTSFARSLLDDVDAASACLTLGAIRIDGVAIGNPGYLRIRVGTSSYFQIAWGTANFVAGGTNIYYASPFPNAGFPVISGGTPGVNTQVNNPCIVGGSAVANGFYVDNPRNTAVSGYYIAVGY